MFWITFVPNKVGNDSLDAMIRIMRIFLRHGDDDGDDESHLFSGRILIPLFRPPISLPTSLARSLDRSPRPTFY